MTTITRETIPTDWQKGMTRARARHIKATLCRDGSYRVGSGSRPSVYRLALEAGKVGPCSCQASRRYGAGYVCAHRGAVAVACLFFRSIVVEGVAA